jgi:hypothetical protein
MQKTSHWITFLGLLLTTIILCVTVSPAVAQALTYFWKFLLPEGVVLKSGNKGMGEK